MVTETMKFQRIISLLLAVLSVICIVSCADNPAVPGTDPSDASETQRKSNLPARSYNGTTVSVMTRQSDDIPQFDSYEIITEENNSTLDDAIIRRNYIVEETYNFKLKETKHTNPGQRTAILALSNDNSVDYVVSQMTDLRAFVPSGALYDLNKMGYSNFDDPWWHTDINSSYSLMGKLFMTMNDYLLMYKQQSYCLFFNKTMADDLHIDNLYDTVERGDWTWDLMYDYMKRASGDLDGDASMTLADKYGFATQYGGLLSSVICSDVHFSYKDADDIPVLDGNNKKHSEVLSKLYDIFIDRNNTVLANDYAESRKGNIYWAIPEETFYEGRALFMNLVVRISKEIMNNSDVDFGIIPLPKISEQQAEYATFSELYNSTVFAIPVTADFDMVSFLLEAFSETSYDIVVPAYYEVTLKSRYTLDERAPKMLDIIFKKYCIDTLLSYNWADIYGFYDLILINKSNTYESYYAAAIDKALETVDRWVDEISKLK